MSINCRDSFSFQAICLLNRIENRIEVKCPLEPHAYRHKGKPLILLVNETFEKEQSTKYNRNNRFLCNQKKLNGVRYSLNIHCLASFLLSISNSDFNTLPERGG